MALLEKQTYGECVAIPQGMVVQGSIEVADSTILRVNEETDPPGFEAPREDFEVKSLDQKP